MGRGPAGGPPHLWGGGAVGASGPELRASMATTKSGFRAASVIWCSAPRRRVRLRPGSSPNRGRSDSAAMRACTRFPASPCGPQIGGGPPAGRIATTGPCWGRYVGPPVPSRGPWQGKTPPGFPVVHVMRWWPQLRVPYLGRYAQGRPPYRACTWRRWVARHGGRPTGPLCGLQLRARGGPERRPLHGVRARSRQRGPARALPAWRCC